MFLHVDGDRVLNIDDLAGSPVMAAFMKPPQRAALRKGQGEGHLFIEQFLCMFCDFRLSLFQCSVFLL